MSRNAQSVKRHKSVPRYATKIVWFDLGLTRGVVEVRLTEYPRLCARDDDATVARLPFRNESELDPTCLRACQEIESFKAGRLTPHVLGPKELTSCPK